MYSSVKPNVFNYLSKAQKSDLCSYIWSYVKKDFLKPPEILTEKFIENEKYYLEIDSTRFKFLANFIEEEEFCNDLQLFIRECKMKCIRKEAQKPLYEAQKAYRKAQEEKLRDFKMGKSPPTKKQIYYYKKLCEKYNIPVAKNLESFSRLEYKNAIDHILKQY